MRPLADIFPTEDYPALLVGLLAPDDAAVYSLGPDRAIVSTVDFFPPVVDDPYTFGSIAAANALSDIYAMGAEPLFAINLVGFPDGLDMGVLTEILRGGAEKVREAGAVIAGGHTVTDREPKYGLAVTGMADPAGLMTKGGAWPGDALVLTKALGTGVITTALKRGEADSAHVDAAVESMMRLNRAAARRAREFGARALTDITGYSLLGHAHEMAHLSGVNLNLSLSDIEWLAGARQYAESDIVPGGTARNRAYYEQWVQAPADARDWELNLLYDPQTSGGLLMSVAPDVVPPLLEALRADGDRGFVIGDVSPGDGHIHILR